MDGAVLTGRRRAVRAPVFKACFVHNMVVDNLRVAELDGVLCGSELLATVGNDVDPRSESVTLLRSNW